MRIHSIYYSADISNILEVQGNVLKEGKVTESEIRGFHSSADENLSHLDCETCQLTRLNKSTRRLKLRNGH